MKQESFIQTIRRAVGVDPDTPRTCAGLFAPRVAGQAEGVLERARRRSAAERQALIERLEAKAGPINLKVLQAVDLSAATAAVTALIDNRLPEWGDRKRVVAWRHPLIEKLKLKKALKGIDVPVVFAPLEGAAGEDIDGDRRLGFRADVAAAFVGVTSADYCVADSATLVMKTRPGQPRSVSLVPSIHVAVISEEQVLADLKELYALLCVDPAHLEEGLTNCMTFISGPSKTADIEAQMVHGAHGPRELHLVVLKVQDR